MFSYLGWLGFVWARCSRIWDGWGLFGLGVLVSGMVECLFGLGVLVSGMVGVCLG